MRRSNGSQTRNRTSYRTCPLQTVRLEKTIHRTSAYRIRPPDPFQPTRNRSPAPSPPARTATLLLCATACCLRTLRCRCAQEKPTYRQEESSRTVEDPVRPKPPIGSTEHCPISVMSSIQNYSQPNTNYTAYAPNSPGGASLTRRKALVSQG